ncbi:hypothetical protein [Ornithinibacillus caprae]
MSNLENEYLHLINQQFRHFKKRAEMGIEQLTEKRYMLNRARNLIL